MSNENFRENNLGIGLSYTLTMANIIEGTSYQKKRSLFDAVYQKLINNGSPNLSDHNYNNGNTSFTSGKINKKKLNSSKTSTSPIDLNQLYKSFQVFQGAQLSVWHDTAGPVIEQSWYYKELPLDFKQFIARQTLCGLDPKNTCDEFRFNIYPDQGVLVLSHIFNSKYNDSLTKFALSLYLSINFFNDYLPIHDIIVDRITCLSCKLLKMYTLNLIDQSDLFTKELVLTMINIEHLFLSNYNEKCGSISVSNTCFNDSKIDQDFLIRVLTSHFQTYGSTIIIGSNADLVYQWMDTIYLFLTPKERKLTTRNLNLKEYIPDIMIQGFLNENNININNSINNNNNMNNNNNNNNMNNSSYNHNHLNSNNNNINNINNNSWLKQIDERLHFSLRPSTVVDLDKGIVYQTKRNHEYVDKRIDLFSKLIVDNYHQGKEFENLTPFKNSNSIFITKMVNEVFQLPFHLKEVFLMQSIKSLLRKSSIVITTLQHLSFTPAIEQKYKISQLFTPPLNEVDIELLYGLAEKLQFYLFVSVTKPESFGLEDTIMEILAL
ncbi:hypothetical protein ACTFIW_010228 [Dictyostelium discoideum]